MLQATLKYQQVNESYTAICLIKRTWPHGDLGDRIQKIDSALGTVYDYQIDGTLLPENATNSTSRTNFGRDLPFQQMQ